MVVIVTVVVVVVVAAAFQYYYVIYIFVLYFLLLLFSFFSLLLTCRYQKLSEICFIPASTSVHIIMADAIYEQGNTFFYTRAYSGIENRINGRNKKAVVA